jgi:hypothetical protein
MLLMIKLFSEPQVNLRNHLPPGDSLLCWINAVKCSVLKFVQSPGRSCESN